MLGGCRPRTQGVRLGRVLGNIPAGNITLLSGSPDFQGTPPCGLRGSLWAGQAAPSSLQKAGDVVTAAG